MNDESSEVKQKKSKNKPAREEPDVDGDIPEMPKIFDKDAEHRKVMAVMIGLFVVVLLVMVFFQNYLDFASTGGM